MSREWSWKGELCNISRFFVLSVSFNYLLTDQFLALNHKYFDATSFYGSDLPPLHSGLDGSVYIVEWWGRKLLYSSTILHFFSLSSISILTIS